MNRIYSFILFLSWACFGSCLAQTLPSPGEMAASPSPVPEKSTPPPKNGANSAASPAVPANVPPTPLDRLTQSNHDLIELLKKQQAVLEDIQYDRRLQNRQIQLLEVRLEEMIQKNADLETKLAAMRAAAAAPAASSGTGSSSSSLPASSAAPSEAVTLPAAPATYLPEPEIPGAPGTLSWHRLFVLSGSDSRTTDLFHVQGKQWRVLWHNQDRGGESYKNTSALFISAFPKDDNIPQKVCSKLGSGGDSSELAGPGNYFLKIEASGGKWELAVEDFQ